MILFKYDWRKENINAVSANKHIYRSPIKNLSDQVKKVSDQYTKYLINIKKYLINIQRCIRSRRPKVFCKKGVLRNFAKLTGKYLCHSLFFNKVAGLRSTTLLKKRLWRRCFAVNFAKFLRTPFFTEHLQWLLLVYSGSCQTSMIAEVPII